MITVFGQDETSERRGAERLRELAALWAPAAVKSGQLHIDIFCNVTKPGSGYRDIDILLSLWSEGGDKFPAIAYSGRSIAIRDVVALLELKDHGPGRVEFTRTSLTVLYASGPENVTEKLKGMPGQFKAFLKKRGLPYEPRIGTAAWLTRVAHDCAPVGFDNATVVFADATFNGFVHAIIESGVEPRKLPDGSFELTSYDGLGKGLPQSLRKVFGEILPARQIGRRSFDVAFDAWFKGKDYAKDVGRKMFLVKGGAGTGKTIVLLRMLRDLIADENAAVIFTSYNVALLGDLRGKMMAWKRVEFSEYLADGRLTLSSVYELIAAVAQVLSVDMEGGEVKANFERRSAWLNRVRATYDELGLDARDLFAAEWNERYETSFESTFIAIDEAQDLLPLERDLLIRIFGHERILVAFSDYQVSRVGKPTRWERPKDEQRVVKLTTVQRSFSLLTEFSKVFAQEHGLDTEDARQATTSFTGGKIAVVEGDYFRSGQLHERLAADLSSLGNQPIDMLFLVPAGDGRWMQAEASTIGALEAAGVAVWDGTDPNVRRRVQTHESQVRLLNYQSGRGLEAWTVVARGLDVYYDWLMDKRPDFDLQEHLFPAEREIEAHRQCVRRIMMPLTRAVHTLVIEIRDPQSAFAQHLRRATDRFTDDITWVRGDDAEVARAVDVPAQNPLAVPGQNPPSADVALLTDLRIVGELAPRQNGDRSHVSPIPAERHEADERESAPLHSPTTEHSAGGDGIEYVLVLGGVKYVLQAAGWVTASGERPDASVLQALNQMYEEETLPHDAALDSVEACLAIARRACAAGQIIRALRCAERSLELMPREERCASAVVAVLRKAKRHDDALRLLREYKGTVHRELVCQGTNVLCDLHQWRSAALALARLDLSQPSDSVVKLKRRILRHRPDLAALLGEASDLPGPT